MVAGVRWALTRAAGGGDPAVKEGRNTNDGVSAEDGSDTCDAGDQTNGGTCAAGSGISDSDPTDKYKEEEDRSSSSTSRSRDDHLAIAAQYYRRAAEDHESARANFNLGFMHEWGLGLKQDFPLAKRHYDLAATSRSGEAELAVQIALMAMNIHEKWVRAWLAWEEWQTKRKERLEPTAGTGEHEGSFESAPSPSGAATGDPVTGSSSLPRTGNEVMDIIFSHFMSGESLLIALLTLLLAVLIRALMGRRR